MSSRFFAFVNDLLSSRSPFITLVSTTHPNALTNIDDDEDGESSFSRGSQIETVPPLDHQHPRRGPGALETQVCVLDPSAPSRGEGGSEGQVGGERGSESVGRMGKEESDRKQGGRTSGIVEMTRYVGPNGWMFFPDSSGYSTEELFWRENMELRQHTYSRVGPNGTVESLGQIYCDIDPWDAAYDPQYVSALSYYDALCSFESPYRRCFNCGATGHSFRSCSEPPDHALISLTRAYYQFFKQSGEGQPLRIHEVEEWKLQRLRWLEEFDPGEIRGPVLRDALGLLDENDLGENAPWLRRIMDWGYPKGWVGSKDPREMVHDRFLNGQEDVDYEHDGLLQEFVVHGEEGEERLQLPCLPISRSTRPASRSATVEYHSAVDAGSQSTSSGSTLRSRSSSPIPSSSSGSANEQRRWAQYKTSLFISDRLPVYSGKSLPSMNEESEYIGSQVTAQRTLIPGVPQYNMTLATTTHCPHCANDIEPSNIGFSHPWRYPGAFDAFGPVGWMESYAKAKAKLNAQRESQQCPCDCHSRGLPEGHRDDPEPSSSVAKLAVAGTVEDLDNEVVNDDDTDMELSD